MFHHIPEDIHYPPFGNTPVLPYETPGLISTGHIPFSAAGPLYYDHPTSGFNPFFDAPPSFPVNSHYRNANNYTNNAREDRSLKNKNIVFPNNRKKRTVDIIGNSDLQHNLSRSRVSLIFNKTTKTRLSKM